MEADSIVKMVIAYDGTDFFGWQRQPNHRNVQGIIEKVLSKLLDRPIQIDGAGRTDTGVHAAGQVATFSGPVNMPLNQLKKVMNNFLPNDIAIVSVEYEDEMFHARYSATGKTYKYSILNHEEKDVFKGRYSYEFPYQLDLNLMKIVCEKLEGYHNFESFKASGSSAQNPMRTIHKIEIIITDQEIDLIFTGDGFLYKMVRILAAFILNVSSGRIPLEKVDEILEKPSRKYTNKVAPAHGLTLMEVYYK